MSRSYKSTGVRGQSSAISQAQQIAAQQMAFNGGLGVTGLSGASAAALRSSPLAATTAARTRPLSATVGRIPGRTNTTIRRPAARGSAAPTDAGIDLSAFSGLGHTANLAATVPHTDVPTDANSGLENEYIVNLQQQVYFLELELNLLKKAGGGGGSTNPAGLRGAGAPSGDSGSAITDANVPDAPLDDVMLSLREKYVKMEAEYKKELEDIRNENAELRSRARMRELEINNLKALHGNLTNETQNWKATAQDHQSTLLDHQLANEQMILKLTNRLQKREKKLEKLMEDYVHLKAEFKVAQENYAAERDAYTIKWNEREKKMDELNESYLREKETNLEWAERFRQSNEQKLMLEIQDLQQIQLSMESAVKKAELTRDQAEKNKQSALESLDKIMEENESLRSAIQAMEAEQKMSADKEERDRKSKTFWSAEVANMQTQLEALTEKLNKLNAKYAETKTVKKQLKDELIQSRVYLDELTQRLGEEQDTHNKTRLSEEELNELTRELKRDLTIKTEELQTLMSKYKELKVHDEEASKERDHLHVEFTELKAKFDINEALQQLKLHEFVSMAHSNLKVAGAIENLMGKMKKGEVDVKKEKRELARRERSSERFDESDLYSEASSSTGAGSITPKGSRSSLSTISSSADSRPTTQDSDITRSSDSRPVTSSSVAESSFDGI